MKKVPEEIVDLLRFMCETWSEIDTWAYKYCDGDALGRYPVIQGSRNQIDLKTIGQQDYNIKNIRNAVDWMLLQ